MKELPAETRWHIAARCASSLPVLYSYLLRERMGEEFDHLVEEIWCQIGSQAQELAAGLDLPVDSVEHLAATLLEILRTLFGPEFRGEILDLSSERAVILINRCPFLMRSRELGEISPAIFHPCLAFCVSATETLHRDFSTRYIRAMCMGDKNCELRIARKETFENI
jgi:hypothetical protein